MKTYTIVIILPCLLAVLAIFVPSFFAIGNLINILFQNAVMGVMAVGMTFLLITGYRDLSVGALMGLCATLTMGMQKHGLFVSILVPLLVGVLVGLVNAFLVTKAGLSSFVVTFATMYACRGASYLYSGEKPIIGIIDSFGEFGSSSFLRLPIQVWILLGLVLIAQFVLSYTKHGRNTYVVGGNAATAQSSGINVDRTSTINFVICSVSTALGGVLMAAKINSATPTLGWPDTQLTVITMVVLGGTRLTGGFGNVFCTLGGVLTIGILNNIIDMLRVEAYYSTMFMGSILIIVLLLDLYLKPGNNLMDVMK